MPPELAVERLPDLGYGLGQVMTQPFLQVSELAAQLLASCFPL
jgi:hypothetical protein